MRLGCGSPRGLACSRHQPACALPALRVLPQAQRERATCLTAARLTAYRLTAIRFTAICLTAPWHWHVHVKPGNMSPVEQSNFDAAHSAFNSPASSLVLCSWDLNSG